MFLNLEHFIKECLGLHIMLFFQKIQQKFYLNNGILQGMVFQMLLEFQIKIYLY